MRTNLSKLLFRVFFQRKKKRQLRKSLIRAFKLKEVFEYYINTLVNSYYDGKHPKHHLWTEHTKFIDDNVNEGDKVLDVGCGASLTYNQRIAPKVKLIDAFDKKKKLVQICIKGNKYDNVHFSVMDIEKELPSKKYDVAILSHVLEHNYNPKSILERLKSVTSKLIIQVPRYNDHWWYLVKKDLGLFYFKDKDHKREYTQRTAEELIRNSGWTILKSFNDVDVKIIAVNDGK